MVCFGYIIVNTLYKDNYNINMRATVSRNKRCDHSVCDHWRMVQDVNIRTRHNIYIVYLFRHVYTLSLYYFVGRIKRWDPWLCITCRGQLCWKQCGRLWMALCWRLWMYWWHNVTDVDIGFGIAVSTTFLYHGN
jgi:hypothetical protein